MSKHGVLGPGRLVGGLVATVVMSLMMTMASAMGLTRMPPVHLIAGAMVSGDKDVATKVASSRTTS